MLVVPHSRCRHTYNNVQRAAPIMILDGDKLLILERVHRGYFSQRFTDHANF